MNWIHAVAGITLTVAGHALAAPPARDFDQTTWDTLHRAAKNRDLQETKSVIVHVDASWIPAEQQARSARMRPGGDVTDYKWFQVAARPPPLLTTFSTPSAHPDNPVSDTRPYR